MKYLKKYQLATLILYVCGLTALAFEIFPSIKEFFIWLLPEKDPQLVLTTLILAGITAWLVIETRCLGKIDRQPWLFISTVFINPDYLLMCELKNAGKVPVVYKVESYEASLNDEPLKIPEHLYNNGDEVFQGEVRSFTFGNIEHEVISKIGSEWERNHKQGKKLIIIKGKLKLYIKYALLNGTCKKEIIKDFVLELCPQIRKDNDKVQIGFTMKHFDILTKGDHT